MLTSDTEAQYIFSSIIKQLSERLDRTQERDECTTFLHINGLYERAKSNERPNGISFSTDIEADVEKMANHMIQICTEQLAKISNELQEDELFYLNHLIYLQGHDQIKMTNLQLFLKRLLKITNAEDHFLEFKKYYHLLNEFWTCEDQLKSHCCIQVDIGVSSGECKLHGIEIGYYICDMDTRKNNYSIFTSLCKESDQEKLKLLESVLEDTDKDTIIQKLRAIVLLEKVQFRDGSLTKESQADFDTAMELLGYTNKGEFLEKICPTKFNVVSDDKAQHNLQCFINQLYYSTFTLLLHRVNMTIKEKIILDCDFHEKAIARINLVSMLNERNGNKLSMYDFKANFSREVVMHQIYKTLVPTEIYDVDRRMRDFMNLIKLDGKKGDKSTDILSLADDLNKGKNKEYKDQFLQYLNDISNNIVQHDKNGKINVLYPMTRSNIEYVVDNLIADHKELDCSKLLRKIFKKYTDLCKDNTFLKNEMSVHRLQMAVCDYTTINILILKEFLKFINPSKGDTNQYVVFGTKKGSGEPKEEIRKSCLMYPELLSYNVNKANNKGDYRIIQDEIRTPHFLIYKRHKKKARVIDGGEKEKLKLGVEEVQPIFKLEMPSELSQDISEQSPSQNNTQSQNIKPVKETQNEKIETKNTKPTEQKTIKQSPNAIAQNVAHFDELISKYEKDKNKFDASENSPFLVLKKPNRPPPAPPASCNKEINTEFSVPPNMDIDTFIPAPQQEILQEVEKAKVEQEIKRKSFMFERQKQGEQIKRKSDSQLYLQNHHLTFSPHIINSDTSEFNLENELNDMEVTTLSQHSCNPYHSKLMFMIEFIHTAKAGLKDQNMPDISIKNIHTYLEIARDRIAFQLVVISKILANDILYTRYHEPNIIRDIIHSIGIIMFNTRQNREIIWRITIKLGLFDYLSALLQEYIKAPSTIDKYGVIFDIVRLFNYCTISDKKDIIKEKTKQDAKYKIFHSWFQNCGKSCIPSMIHQMRSSFEILLKSDSQGMDTLCRHARIIKNILKTFINLCASSVMKEYLKETFWKLENFAELFIKYFKELETTYYWNEVERLSKNKKIESTEEFQPRNTLLILIMKILRCGGSVQNRKYEQLLQKHCFLKDVIQLLGRTPINTCAKECIETILQFSHLCDNNLIEDLLVQLLYRIISLLDAPKTEINERMNETLIKGLKILILSERMELKNFMIEKLNDYFDEDDSFYKKLLTQEINVENVRQAYTDYSNKEMLLEKFSARISQRSLTCGATYSIMNKFMMAQTPPRVRSRAASPTLSPERPLSRRMSVTSLKSCDTNASYYYQDGTLDTSSIYSSPSRSPLRNSFSPKCSSEAFSDDVLKGFTTRVKNVMKELMVQ